MTVQRVFIEDQVDAPAADAHRFLHRVAVATGADVTEGSEHPVARRLIREFNGGLAFGLIRPCPHVPPAPAITWWLPRAPDALHCVHCAVGQLITIHGTREDSRCDGCSQLVDAITPTAAAAGALIVSAGLCRPCFEDTTT